MTLRPTRDIDRPAGISCAATRARRGPASNQKIGPHERTIAPQPRRHAGRRSEI